MDLNDQAKPYFDAFLGSYDALTKTVGKTNTRALRVSKRFMGDLTKHQQAGIALAQRLSETPFDQTAYSTVLEAVDSAHVRVLGFAEVVNKESVGANGELQDAFKIVQDAGVAVADATFQPVQAWPSTNPWLEMIQETLKPARP